MNTDLKTDSFVLLESSRFVTRAIKLTQNCVCFAIPCINLLVPLSVTREYHNKIL